MTHQDVPVSFVPPQPGGRIPSDAECRCWWDDYAMLEHIKAHSELVAKVATTLAKMAADLNRGCAHFVSQEVFMQSVRAAGLLHDLGKTYAIQHGGNHSQIGAAWVMELTRNPVIAQGVVHHVFWPGTLDLDIHFLPLAVIYADKRVKHDMLVSVDERFSDLFDRYGHSERSREWIRRSHSQNLELEKLFSVYLGEDIHAHSFDRRRLVR